MTTRTSATIKINVQIHVRSKLNRVFKASGCFVGEEWDVIIRGELSTVWDSSAREFNIDMSMSSWVMAMLIFHSMVCKTLFKIRFNSCLVAFHRIFECVVKSKTGTDKSFSSTPSTRPQHRPPRNHCDLQSILLRRDSCTVPPQVN